VIGAKRDSLSISSAQPIEITRANRPAVPDMSANSTFAELLDAEQLAARLNVPPSWVRSRSRSRTPREERIPVIRLGRYCRYRWPEVSAWLQARVSR
jgi:hypothetical protein